MSRNIGISLDDDFTELCIGTEGQERTLPTMLCKKKNSDTWLIGEAAYKATLDGSGVLVDKLLSLLRKNGTATIEHTCYSGEELMERFLRTILSEDWEAAEESAEPATEKPAEPSAEKRSFLTILPAGSSLSEEEAETAEAPDSESGQEPAGEEGGNEAVVLSIRRAEQELFRKLGTILERICGEAVHAVVVSHTEAYVHYILHQDKNLYSRLVGMFELSNQCLYYYEMQVSRGSRRYAMAGSEAQEEAFSLDILKTPSGIRIADRILSALADRNLHKKSFSSIFLSGRGFETTDFAPDFMRRLCRGRRVCIEPRIFAIGALCYARLLSQGEKEEYTILCDTRASCDVSVRVVQKEREQRLPIIHAGDCWANRSMECEMILDRQNYVDFQLSPLLGGQRPAQLRMLLTGFPERENRTTRISLNADFLDAGRLRVTVKDLGFGELFPASSAVVSEEIDLRRTMGDG